MRRWKGMNGMIGQTRPREKATTGCIESVALTKL
jgi:hypothetical protein